MRSYSPHKILKGYNSHMKKSRILLKASRSTTICRRSEDEKE